MERLIRLVKEYQRLDALSKSSTSLTPQEAQRKRELKAVLDHYFQEEKPHAPPTPPPTYNTPQTQEVEDNSLGVVQDEQESS